MKRIIAIPMFMCAIAFQCLAHNAKIATFTLRDTGAGWLVEMNFAQAGVDAAMVEIYGVEKLRSIDKNVYQNLIVDYVKTNFHLTVNGHQIKLGSGGIMLGSHQTDLKFVLPDMPVQPEHAEIYLPLFGDTYNHTNLFRIYRGGKNITKFFLSEDNDFRVNIAFTPQGIIEEHHEPESKPFLMVSGGGLMLVLIMVIAFSGKKIKA